MAEVFYDAFISYSTKDSEIVTQLRLLIEATGRRVWQDVKELEVTEAWWEQIKRGIFASDNFVFVASPRSMSSPVCHLELEYARELKKRIIIINHESADKETGTRAMIERLLNQPSLKLISAGRDMLGLADTHWQTLEMEQNITIRQSADLSEKVPKLLEAFDKDLLYIRQANILMARAKEWDDSGKNASFLLIGDALTSAEAWVKLDKKPAPTPQHLAFINASRDSENERERLVQDQERRAKQLRRASRVAGIVGLIAFIVAVIASFATVQALQAVEAADIAQEISVEFANIVLQYGDNPEAQLSQIDELLRRYPNEPRAHLSHGIIAHSQQNYVLAVSDFTHAIELDSNYTGAYINRARTYRALGQSDAALNDAHKAIELEPEWTDGYMERARIRLARREYEAAIADYDLAVEADPDYAPAYYNRGTVYETLQYYPQALDSYQQAIDLDSGYANAYWGLGNVYFRLGQKLECANAYLRYRELTGRFEPGMQQNFDSCTL